MANINDLVKKSADQVNGKQEETFTAKHSITINDKVYKIKPLSFEDGIDLWEDIMKRLMPSVGAGLDRMSHNDLLDGSPTTFTEAMIHLSKNLDGSTFKNYSIVLLDGATVDGQPLDLNAEFAGNYGTWKKLFSFAIKENFSSFFEDGWANGLQDMMTLVSPVMTQPVSE